MHSQSTKKSNGRCILRSRTTTLAWLLSSTFLLSCTFSSHFTLAQSTASPYAQPISVSGAASARTATKLYIVSGRVALLIPQFISLDLSVPWNASQPAWQRLADGPHQDIFPAVFSADEKTMIAFHCGSTFAMKYDIATNTWSKSTAVAQYGHFEGIGAVTDPLSGLVYLAGGYTGARESISIYDFRSDSFEPVSTPLPKAPTLFRARAYYGNVYCKQRNSILYFGGYNISMKSNRQDNVVSEYIPSTGIWQTLLTSGPSPAMRADHCMTANDDGSLIVIYGGSLAGSTFLNDIYILNTISQTWSMGTAGMTRAYATCTIAGDQLLVWGGLDGYKELANTDVQIYNIHKNAWVTTYIPPASYIDTNPTQRTPSSPLPSDESSNAASIAGGIAGGLVVIAGVILLFIFLRRKRGGQYELSLINTKYEEDYDSTPARQQTSRNEEEELRDLRAHILTQQEELDMQRRVLIAQQEQNQEHHRQQIQLFQQQQEQQPRECYQAGYPYQPPITHGAGVATPEPLVVYSDSYIQIPSSSSNINGYYPPPPPPPPPNHNACLSLPLDSISSPAPSYTMLTVATDGSTMSPLQSHVDTVSVLDGGTTSIDTRPADQQRDQRPLEKLGNPQFGARIR